MRVDTRRVKNFLLDLAFKNKKQMIKKLKLIEKKYEERTQIINQLCQENSFS